MKLFNDAAVQLLPEPVKDWKASGKPVVGYTCSYLPVEIFHAAGILPLRLRGIDTDGMEIADTYYGPFVCSFPKCILQLAGKGRYRFLDGAIITPGCDTMRRLDECWRKAEEDHPGILPAFFHYFDTPHKITDNSLNWFKKEIVKLIDALEAHFNVTVTTEALQAAIRRYNQDRAVLRAIEKRRAEDPPPILGAECFAATVAGSVLPRDLFSEALREWAAALGDGRSVSGRPLRLMVVGSISDSIELFQLAEDGTTAVVVSENLCFGVHSDSAGVDETGDPVTALAEYYLGQMTCPRYFGAYPERLAMLRNKINRVGVDGVIMQNIRFCDLHGADNALFEKDLEADGIPCLRLEREYGPQSDTGRMKLRIEAFIERISRWDKRNPISAQTAAAEAVDSQGAAS